MPFAFISVEERQQQIRGVLEARNPVGEELSTAGHVEFFCAAHFGLQGFPCHVNAGDDFFCRPPRKTHGKAVV